MFPGCDGTYTHAGNRSSLGCLTTLPEPLMQSPVRSVVPQNCKQNTSCHPCVTLERSRVRCSIFGTETGYCEIFVFLLSPSIKCRHSILKRATTASLHTFHNSFIVTHPTNRTTDSVVK